MNGLALFAGVGGLELGLELIIPSIRTVAYVEREAFSASVLVARMEEEALHPAPIWDDVTTFPSEKFRGKVDFISAGFPCQPFSKAGLLKGKEDDRWLWEDIEEIIRTVEPKYLFLENVPGIANRGLDSVLGSLSSLGFDAEWTTLRASESGSPHLRERIFILGFKPEWIQELTDSMRLGCLRDPPSEGRARGIRKGAMAWSQPESLCEDASNTNGKRSKRSGIPNLEREKIPDIERGWWEIEPPICRVDDGMADRMDRLRSCGNGVVPIQAAHAFRSLACRAIGIEWTDLIDGVGMIAN